MKEFAFVQIGVLMSQVYNFSSGPSVLPEEVLEKAKNEIFNYKRTGVSVMELGASSREVEKLIEKAEKSLRKIMSIPPNYKILFLPGGASSQFAAIPMNLLSDRKCADYIVSGKHSKKAVLEAKKYGDIAIAASSAGASPAFSTVPETKRSDFRPDADYVHICFNNSVYGTTFHYIPDTGNIPLVADMSSYILSEPFDVSKFALIYASSQQNIGPAGMSVVIIRDDLLGAAHASTPSVLNYQILAETKSRFSTPPIWSIYVATLVFDWILSVGGLEEIKRRNERKASLLYDYLDSQFYYTASVDKKCRSMMNVVFVTGDADLDKKFIKEAEEAKLLNLAGDKNIGGMRASIYNAMPYEGVEKLVEFMKNFAAENPKLN